MRTTLFLPILLLSLASRGQLTQHNRLSAGLDSLFERQDPGRPGFALRIEKKGEVLYQRAVGLANDSTKTTIDSNTDFRMASVSKQFTAMAILLLEKEHKLSFEDPIGKYLPELPADIGHHVLIRHLLTHSSGVWDYESLIPSGRTTQLLDADVLQLLASTDSTYFAPGTHFRYSNSGFCLLALIVEKASGQPFAAFLKEKIFKPLGMDGSLVYEPGNDFPHRAMGYARDSTGQIYFSDQSITSATKGDGGVYTSLHDYAKWVKALQDNRLLKLSAVIKKLRFPLAATQAPRDSYYAAGWFDMAGSPETLFHSGGTCGFSTFVIQQPADQWSITYFSNIAGNTGPFGTILHILERNGFDGIAQVLQLHDLTR